jgi:predicted regulator of Ras-like GTPase activity (Roadblock/LC7/MglB family)
MLWAGMDVQQALADLTEISSQIQSAVVFGADGKVAGSTLADSGRAAALVTAASELLSVAEGLRSGQTALTQLEVATAEGSVFAVREGETSIVATTGSNPTVGLVFYDLKSALRSVKATPRPAAKAPARKKTATAASGQKTAAASKKKTAARKPPTRKKPDAP